MKDCFGALCRLPSQHRGAQVSRSLTADRIAALLGYTHSSDSESIESDEASDYRAYRSSGDEEMLSPDPASEPEQRQWDLVSTHVPEPSATITQSPGPGPSDLTLANPSTINNLQPSRGSTQTPKPSGSKATTKSSGKKGTAAMSPNELLAAGISISNDKQIMYGLNFGDLRPYDDHTAYLEYRQRRKWIWRSVTFLAPPIILDRAFTNHDRDIISKCLSAGQAMCARHGWPADSRTIELIFIERCLTLRGGKEYAQKQQEREQAGEVRKVGRPKKPRIGSSSWRDEHPNFGAVDSQHGNGGRQTGPSEKRARVVANTGSVRPIADGELPNRARPQSGQGISKRPQGTKQLLRSVLTQISDWFAINNTPAETS